MPDKADDIKVLTTDRPGGPENKSVLRTPSAAGANVSVVTLTWYSQVGIRVARTYAQALLGFILAIGSGTADAVGIQLPVGDFLDLFIKSAGLAVAPAVVAALQNSIELLSKLDTGSPQLRA